MGKRSTPLKPDGDSPFALFCQWVWDFLADGKFPFGDTDTVKHSWENGVHYFNAKIPPSQPSVGRQWQNPNKEIDPTLTVKKGTLVYVTENNAIAVAGLFDLVSGLMVTAKQGTWEALLDVPAQVVNPAGKPTGTYYNVPVWPPPNATGNTSGSPGSLKGDLDDPTLFWFYWGDIFC